MKLLLVDGISRPGYMKDIEKIENIISKRLPIGSAVSYSSLIKEMVENKARIYFSIHPVYEICKIGTS